MAGLGRRSNEEINAILKKIMPECDSEYARYPMAYPRWLKLGEKGPKGEPTWIKSDQNAGIKKDYVYGRGPGGPAYYHLLTTNAYVNLYTKVSNARPGGCCAFSAEAREKVDEWDCANRILHARHVSKIPNDGEAAKAQMASAKDSARVHYDANVMQGNFGGGAGPGM
ncbi:unnamed protein product [Cylindrotheca closterium]|uniref:Uncharacterized protein n=1 Tax=Cylindrotheca closterium TaxID=2856 RepID=A0AAD2CJX0_9STRA|nr:unnamed protein product [Cylindrotheca closterium]